MCKLVRGKRCQRSVLKWKALDQEKRKFLAGFLISDSEIEKSLNLVKEHLDKINKETLRVEEILFNGAKKTFRVNDQKLGADILSVIADDEAKFLIF